MNNDLKVRHKSEIALMNGEKTTTKSGPTAVWWGFTTDNYSHSIEVNSLPFIPATINFKINLTKLDHFFINGMSQGGRSIIEA
jgi:hypothetical protein